MQKPWFFNLKNKFCDSLAKSKMEFESKKSKLPKNTNLNPDFRWVVRVFLWTWTIRQELVLPGLQNRCYFFAFFRRAETAWCEGGAWDTRTEGSSSKKEKALVPHRTRRLRFASQLRNPVLQDNYQQVRPFTHHLAVFAFLLHSKAWKDIFFHDNL